MFFHLQSPAGIPGKQRKLTVANRSRHSHLPVIRLQNSPLPGQSIGRRQSRFRELAKISVDFAFLTPTGLGSIGAQRVVDSG